MYTVYVSFIQRTSSNMKLYLGVYNIVAVNVYSILCKLLFELHSVYVCSNINQLQSTIFSSVGGFVYLIK